MLLKSYIYNLRGMSDFHYMMQCLSSPNKASNSDKLSACILLQITESSVILYDKAILLSVLRRFCTLSFLFKFLHLFLWLILWISYQIINYWLIYQLFLYSNTPENYFYVLIFLEQHLQIHQSIDFLLFCLWIQPITFENYRLQFWLMTLMMYAS